MSINIDAYNLPTRWEICDVCRGEGKSSAYLGAFTRSEFDECFDPSEQDEYFAGAYDRACEHCNGSGKIKVIDHAQCGKAEATELAQYNEDCQQDAYDAATYQAENRLSGDYW